MSRITAHTASGLSKSVTADNADDRSPEPDPGTPDGALVKQALFLGTSQADSLIGGDENDQIFGDAQDDTLSGGLGDDFVSGWSGNDLLYLSQGMDTLSGGTGSDTLSAFELTEGVVITLDDSDPNSDDYGAGSYVSGTASGTFTGIEALVGTVSADTLTGGRGADILTGGLGDDVIRGGAGADRVIIAADIQSVTIYHTETGGYRVLSVDGDDLFDGIEQFDFMVGDILTASLDVLAMDLIARPAPVNGNLTPQPTISGTAESDTLTGTAAADTISGDGGDDLITGAANNDFLIGGAGNDRLDGGGGSDSLFGGLGDDTLLLSTGSDVLYGDLPLPLPPQDEGIDTLDATSAELQALLENGHDLNGNTAGIQVTFTGDGDGLVEAPTYVMVDDGTGPVPERVETLASLRGIEVVLGTVHDDTLTGHDGSETLRGGAGDDLLTAGAGDDLLDGGAGNDTLRLGEGLDTVLGGDGIDQMSGSLLEQGLVVTVTSGNTAVGSSGSFATGDAVNTFSGIEIFEGSSLADRMTGGAANETMIGGAGDDTLSGGAGTDVAVIGASFLQSSIYRTETGLRIVSDQGNDLYTGFETFAFRNVTLGLADILQVALPDPDDGSFVPVPDNYISGTNSDDTLTGTDLFDQIDGAGGNDLIRGDSGGDVLIGGSGNDTLDGQDGADTLFGGLGNDLLILSRGEDRLFGDLAVDVADAGIDTLDGGGAGLGAVLGGMGLQITFSADGDGTVIANGTSDLSPLADTISSFEGIEVVLGSANGDTITGNVGSETLRGASGDDVLSAGAGADLLDGGAGNDTLYVGSGADSLLGGAGRDMFSGAQLTGPLTLTVSQSDPQAGSYTFGTATGLFTGIEVFEGSDFGDTLTGGAGADTFLGGLGNDVIDGGAGSDVAVIGVDLLDADIYSTDSGFRIVSAQGDDRYSGIETFIFDDVSLDITDITQIAAPENDFNSPGTGSGSDTVDASPLEDVLAPVGDAITSRSDPAIASALFAQGGVTLDSIAYVGAPDAIGLLPGGYLITDGTTSVGIDNGIFLSTGGGPGWQNTTGSYSINNRTAGSDLLDQAAAEIFATAPTTNDAAVLTFTFEGHELGGLSTLSLDLFIGSDEYLGPVQGLFVDFTAIIVNGVNYGPYINDPDRNLATINDSTTTPGAYISNADKTFDTEYDGFTGLLTVLAPVQQGTNTVVIGIADTGDSAYDSGLFVGNLAASDVRTFGSFVNVTGTSRADQIRLGTTPEIVELAGGRDTVSGTLAQVDKDVITGWADDDRLIYTQSFDVSALRIESDARTAVLTVDTDGDGTAEAVTTLVGDFSRAEFVVTAVDGTVQVATVGTLTDPPVILTGSAGDETITGGSAGDLINGGDGNDRIDGGEGNDRLAGGDGNDTVRGGFGSDQLGGGSGNDLVDGGEGNDSLGGGLGDDVIIGGLGNDVIGGGEGRDSVQAGAGADAVSGGADDDVLDGMSGNDTVAGSFGNDVVYGGAGDDSLGGGTGRDTLYAGEGDDTLGGGEGDDVLYGVAGSNFLAGGGRNDLIIGGTGTDSINGGTGNDTLFGGEGRDLFIFNALRVGEIDTIDDFTVGEDQIRLTGVQSFAALNLSAIEIYDGVGVEISVSGHIIQLAGVTATQLDAGDFLFG